MLQHVIVAIAVACASWAVAARYAPSPLRRAMRRGTAILARRAGWETVAVRIEAQASAGGSCGDGCGSCKGCGTTPVATAATGHAAPDFAAAITPDALRRTAAPFRDAR